MKHLIIATLFMFISTTAHTLPQNSFLNFNELLQKYENGELSHSPINTLSKSNLNKIYKFMQKERNLWYDSILEGDYFLGNDDLKIDTIESLTDQNNLVQGYKIIFSQHAFDTATCLNSVDLQTDPLLQNRITFLKSIGCPEGRIVSTIITRYNFKSYKRDQSAIEKFVPQINE